ncbi:porin [Paraburkholderia acidisoli]|uniref:Porin n=1 Tax=Paraburkholderia acidisoli TaxID=2571748 RepID=A0A7Z2GPW4_9BURK|nr:porin [Paraburkholderia acidisoli]QGZ65576.1 porin [Paraburkholderia acidisoli]
METKLVGIGALVCASVCHAQTSVTLYGLVDTGVAYVTNAGGAHQYSMANGAHSGSRWGLRGREDLGGGNDAIFVLEAGFNSANGAIGQNGTEFGRQAFVGLSRAEGSVTLGRQYSPTFELFFPFLPISNGSAGSGFGIHPGDVDNLDTFNRIANSLKITTADYHGLKGEALYSFGGQPGSIARNQIWNVAVRYMQGPLGLAASYQSTDRPNYSFWGDKANDSTTGSNIASPILRGYATAGKQDIFAAAASWKAGPARFNLIYTNTRFDHLGTVAVSGLTPAMAANRGVASINVYEANAGYFVTPFLLVGAAFSYTRNGGTNGREGAGYSQTNAGIDYFVSKRTDLYGLLVHQVASGVDSTGNRAVAIVPGNTASTSNQQTLVTVGIRHKF